MEKKKIVSGDEVVKAVKIIRYYCSCKLFCNKCVLRDLCNKEDWQYPCCWEVKNDWAKE